MLDAKYIQNKKKLHLTQAPTYKIFLMNKIIDVLKQIT